MSSGCIKKWYVGLKLKLLEKVSYRTSDCQKAPSSMIATISSVFLFAADESEVLRIRSAGGAIASWVTSVRRGSLSSSRRLNAR